MSSLDCWKFFTALFFSMATAAHASPIGDDDKGSFDVLILADMDDASFDAQFECPETLATADEREEAFERYTTWTTLRHPDWNFRKRLDVRGGLLRRHACATTLANVSASALPAFPASAYPRRR
jgi:hypothetical protein